MYQDVASGVTSFFPDDIGATDAKRNKLFSFDVALVREGFGLDN